MTSPESQFGQGPLGSGNPYQAPGGFGPQFGPPSAPPSPLLGIASLACGVLSIFFSCCCGLLSIPLSLAAIGLGAVALMKSDGVGKMLAIGGIVCGVLSLLLFVVFLVIALTNPEWLHQFQVQPQ